MIMKSDVTKIYDKFTALRNAGEFKKLTLEVFESYGIHSYRDLSLYLKKYGEYGGAVKLKGSDKQILLPFHNDILNTWLKFDNPRVIQAYEQVYEQFGAEYSDRRDFDRHRFHVEEELLKQCWVMPAMDTRILEAPIAGCWDKMEIQACYMEALGYQVRRYCFHGGKIIRGHTFVLYHDGKYWNTSMRFPLHIRRKNLESLCSLIFRALIHVPILDKGEISQLVEFAAPYEGMTTQEYIHLIERGKVILKCRRKRNKGS